MADQSEKSDKPSQGIFGIFAWIFGGGGEAATTQEVGTPGPEKEELSKEQVLSKFNSELSIEEFNIFIVGCSGEGKSTLINEIFGENLAKVGPFIPTTMKIEKITKEDIPFSLYDTRGLEIIEFDKIKKELLDFVEKKQNKEPSERLHAVWFCISEGTKIQRAHKELVKPLAESIPVIIVITKLKKNNGFLKAVQNLLPEAKDVVRVNAIETKLPAGAILPQEGLDELVEVTAKVLPNGNILRTFSIAQRRIKLKKEQARKAVWIAAASSAVAGAIPIPGVAEGTLVSIQTALLAYISMLFGVKVKSANFWSNILSFLFTDFAGTTVIQGFSKGIIKLIPIGALATALPLITSYGALTNKLGSWYIDFIVEYLENHGDVPSLHVIEQAFKEFFGEIKKDN